MYVYKIIFKMDFNGAFHPWELSYKNYIILLLKIYLNTQSKATITLVGWKFSLEKNLILSYKATFMQCSHAQQVFRNWL